MPRVVALVAISIAISVAASLAATAVSRAATWRGRHPIEEATP